MNRNLKIYFRSGFTLVELMLVVAVIGILATIGTVAYSGAQKRAIDTSVLSDIDNMDSLQTAYGLRTDSVGKEYYSGVDGVGDSDLGFTPSKGNIIDVVINATDYCIRGYNPKGNKKSITDAFTKESSPGACSVLVASEQATTDSDNIDDGTFKWKQISTYNVNGCMVTSNNQVYCWGGNYYGQVGDGSTANRSVPTFINNKGALNGKTVLRISVGSLYTCAIASDERAYCWGNNTYGQVGDGSTSHSAIPTPVNISGVLNGKTLREISAGYYHTCAIASDERAYCWGRNISGQLGNNSTTNSSVPVAVDMSGALNGKTIKKISVGNSQTCAIASDERAYCWGENNFGQLGNNSTTNSSVPVAVDMSGALNGKTIREIKVGQYHTCVIASNNNTYCWGSGSNGQLGNNSTASSSVPVAINTSGALNGKTTLKLAVGSLHACAIASDNNAYCWGRNNNGQLGNNSTANSLVPTPVSATGALSGKQVREISTGEGLFGCAIASDNNAYCWGNNTYGQLGNNSTTDSLVPVMVTRP